MTPTATRTCQCGVPATSPGPFVVCSHCDAARRCLPDCGPCRVLSKKTGIGPRP